MGVAAGRDGLRLGHDLLTPAARVARCRRVAAPAPGLVGPARRGRATGLVARQPGRAKHPGRKRGAHTGRNPTDRGKPGTKRHLLVDRRGTPLAVELSAANCYDSTVFGTLLDAVRPVRQARGRPRKRHGKLHVDKGYDYRKCRLALRQGGIQSRIARRGIESRERLGRHRWVVERTFAWLNRFRRLRVRYERRDDIHLAFTVLGCALITWSAFKRFC